MRLTQPTLLPPPAVRSDPELARLAVALDEAAVLRVWLVARHLTRQGDGSGVVALPALAEALAAHEVAYTPRQLRRLLSQGAGRYWSVAGERLFIRSLVKVAVGLVARAEAVDPALVASNLPGVRDVLTPIGGSLQAFKAHCYAAWLTHREAPTISRDALAGLWGCSPQTLRNWEVHLADFEKRRNYGQCPDDPYHRQHVPDHAYGYLVQTASGIEERLTWQMPNTYIPSGCRQHPHRGQSRKVRVAVHATQSAQNRPADPLRGGQRSRRYWQDGERVYRALV